MKKVLFLTAVAVAMTACSNDVDLGLKDANKQTADNAIGFQVLNKNMSRAALEAEGHYNFGVFGYKSNSQTIMTDYLVGFMGEDANSQPVGYKFTSKQTTDGDGNNRETGKSKWAYEKLGKDSSTDYKYTGNEGYYKNGCDNPNDDDTYYMSNWANQFLRYWDKSTSWTNFYAYSPYYHSSDYENSKVSFDNGTHTMTFPDGYITDGYNDPSKFEFLYAAKNVALGDYGNDVQLSFKHINSKINITFWEEIEGYKVTMMNLISAPNAIGISAAPSIGDTGTPTYAYGEVYKTAGATLTFTSSYEYTGELTVDASNFINKTKYSGVNSGNNGFNNNEYLKFNAPTAPFIATSRDEAKTGAPGTNLNYSTTTYYAIPKNNNTGLMFHVSFVLTNEQTNETITVQNATVYVPSTNCNWEAGKRYIYIFKITKNATGETGDPGTIVPGDPTPGTQALYPIVFDGIQVDDWVDVYNPNGGSHDIN